jgi:drug/metabolite transporter (DMT)-like permease
MVFLGLNTVAAYGALSKAFKYADANRISIVITLNPVITFATLEALLYYSIDWIEITPFSVISYIGAMLVIAGAILAVGLNRN